MTGLDFLKLLLLSAIWGGSFLFMRIAAPEFGPFGLIWLRVAMATVLLSPVLLIRKPILREITANPGKMLFVGLFNAVIPWCLLAFAVLSLEAGFTSLLNAATPISAALIGCLWLKIPLSRWQILGLIIGVSGVAILAGDELQFKEGSGSLAVVATLGATLCYGFISQYIGKYMGQLSNWSITLGNLSAATLLLTPLMIMEVPDSVPSGRAIVCAVCLGVFSTALAFVLLFDLLARNGATAATTVTFIIPIFGVLFGAVFLKEEVSVRMVTGMIVALSGAALTTKLLPRRTSNDLD